MPRKSKKKLFRRGGEQKYSKFVNYQKRINLSSELQASDSNFPILKLVFLMLIISAIVISSPLLIDSLSNLILNTDFSTIFPAIKLPKIEVNFPSIPQISINILPLLNSATSLMMTLSVGFATVIEVLDPRPLLIFLLDNLILMLTSIFSYLKVITIQFITYANPTPILIKSWQIELYLIGFIFNTLYLFLTIVGEGIYTIISFIYYIIAFIFNIFYSIILGIFSIFSFIFNFFAGIFGTMVDTVKTILQIIFETFINPALKITQNIFKTDAEYFSRSLKSLSESVNTLSKSK